MKILFPVDEAYPLFKIGGLGDIGYSLPKALTNLNLDVRIVLPKHPEIDKLESFNQIESFTISYNQKDLNVNVYQGILPTTKVPVYLIEEDTYISQHTDASDNHADKFAVFSLSICQWLISGSHEWKPELIHFHDWHTALIPLILKQKFHHHIPSLGTIHNLAYLGATDTPVLDHLGIPSDQRSFLAKFYDDHVRLIILMEGLLQADAVTAVSPTYAKEILTPEYGEGVEEYLLRKKHDIFGILNGIDLDLFNPQTDPNLFENYTLENVTNGKLANKKALYKKLEFPNDPNHTLIGFVGRVDPGQKGVQLIIEALSQNAVVDAQTDFIFLGTGEPNLEKQLHQAAQNLPNCRIITRYDEPLAAQIYAASDLMLIPSKYEPCGLVQMIAMRYGALPVARRTGGLADTIIHNQDGFLFEDYNTHSMLACLEAAKQSILELTTRQSLVAQAMSKDFSWKTSAQEYLDLYNRLMHAT